MHIRPRIIGWNIAGFVWSIFMGVTAISIGFGAAFPQLNLIAKPFVCPNGDMTAQQNVSNPMPGTTITQVQWSCIDGQTGTQTPLDGMAIGLITGPFYGLLLFLGILLIEAVYTLRNGSDWLTKPVEVSDLPDFPPPEPVGALAETAASARRARKAQAQRGRDAQRAQARLKELKDLRSTNTITEEEYQQKRSEILAEL